MNIARAAAELAVAASCAQFRAEMERAYAAHFMRVVMARTIATLPLQGRYASGGLVRSVDILNPIIHREYVEPSK